MNHKIILITGCNGYIGNHLSRVILEKYTQAKLFGIDIKPRPSVCNCKTFISDVCDKKKVLKIIKDIKPDYIFHLAGLVNSRDWEELYRGNIEKTQAFLDAVAGSGSRARVVIPGSAAEYGRVARADLPITEKQAPNPVNIYGLSKVFQTSLARLYATGGMDVVIGRIFNFIGPGMPEYLAVGTFLKQVKGIKPGRYKNEIVVGNIKTRRDFLDIDDVCAGLAAIAKKGRPGEVYNICSGRSVSMESVLKMMIKKSGVKCRIKVDPKRVKSRDISDTYGSIRKIKSDTGWHPTIPISSSIERCLRWE